jgi:hypothetical protein
VVVGPGIRRAGGDLADQTVVADISSKTRIVIGVSTIRFQSVEDIYLITVGLGDFDGGVAVRVETASWW